MKGDASKIFNERKIESLYTDGACSGNPGPGGWGVVIYFDDGTVHEMGGREEETTNNRMELVSAISALKFWRWWGQEKSVVLYTDSEYVLKGITQWIDGWKKRNWKNASGKSVSNQQLWQELDRLNQPQIRWQHVRGHSGNRGNERCDAIARAFSLGESPAMKELFPSSTIE
ncbi:ribonuclease HI [Geitlerinema sp. PCC 9228]|uniref:ribonuclease HI n=1 Tax=Geitlerinema sp. PCC 9228 TaxID=111611 RepID=UPI000B12ACB0|nr:ribonuclease HI [Geitlerinema sp. PCC 9228]